MDVLNREAFPGEFDSRAGARQMPTPLAGRDEIGDAAYRKDSTKTGIVRDRRGLLANLNQQSRGSWALSCANEILTSL